MTLGAYVTRPQAYEKGNISRFISLLKIGDKVRIKGPKGQFRYTPTLAREFGMIAGGTGITPMLQIVRAALKNPLDRTKLSLIYANVNPEDILLKKELDELASKHSHRFRVYYVLNNPPAQLGRRRWLCDEGADREAPAAHGQGHQDPHVRYVLLLQHGVRCVLTAVLGPPPMITAMK